VSTEPRHRAPADGHAGESALRVVWLYPDLLSTYGDRGNMLILAYRAHLRGLPVDRDTSVNLLAGELSVA